MELSKRLQSIADMVPKGSVVADVGCDHGYLPIYLVEQGIVDGAWALDVGEGPLDRAKANISSKGLSDKIKTRLSDGLKGIEPEDADCIVIAGMGGMLMDRILSEGKRHLSNAKTVILSPQSDVEIVRRRMSFGFTLCEEAVVKEYGHFYFIDKYVNSAGTSELSEAQLKYGSLNITSKEPVFVEYLNKRLDDFDNILGSLPKDSERIKEVRREIDIINEILLK